MTKDDLIEKYRYWNVEDIDWWDSTYDNFKEDMGTIGIEVDDMYFSGFSSQGDGACFEGRVSDWALFLKSVGYTDPILVEHALNHWSFSVKHSGRYYHENCTSFSGDLPMPDGYDTEEFTESFSPYAEEFRTQAWLAVITQFTNTNFEQEFTDAFKDHMRQLYKNLEAEHDYLTSDEAVWESIEANELDDITEEEDE